MPEISGTEGIDGESHPEPSSRPPRKTTLADIAETLLTHLIVTAKDDCDLCEAALVLAISDAAGAFGKPRTARDALVNSLWASLAKAADERSRSKTFQWPMPSLHDVQQQSSGRALQPSLLKKYLTAAGLPVPDSEDPAELLKAMPTLVPPRLIKYVLKAHNSNKWRLGVVTRRLASHGLAFPPSTLFPETKMVEEYVAGNVEPSHLVYLVEILEECAFLRQYCNVEGRVAEMTERMEPSGPRVRPPRSPPRESSYYYRWYDFDDECPFGGVLPPPPPPTYDYDCSLREEIDLGRPPMGRKTGIPAENVFSVYEETLEKMAGDVIIAVAGADSSGFEREEKMKELKEMPDSLKTYVFCCFDDWGCLRNGEIKSVASSSRATLKFRCSHEECDRKTKFTREGFLDHWHKTHFGQAEGYAKPTPARGAAVVQCGHKSCLAKDQNYSFDELWRHAEKAHCHIPDKAAYAPLAIANETLLYNLPELSEIDTNADAPDEFGMWEEVDMPNQVWAPPPQDPLNPRPPFHTYRCGHRDCRHSPSFYSQEEFHAHWCSTHLSEPTQQPPANLYRLRCGHLACSNRGKTFRFPGLKSHTEAVHGRDEPPLAVMVLDDKA